MPVTLALDKMGVLHKPQGRCPLMCCWMMVDVILISFEQVITEYNYQQQLKKLDRKLLMREYGERHEVWEYIW